jgi:hypothetical protein
MATLKSRLEQLESKAPDQSNAFCLVVHESENCANDRADAVAAYISAHGREPTNYFDVVLVSAQTQRSVCGCKTKDERESACAA